MEVGISGDSPSLGHSEHTPHHREHSYCYNTSPESSHRSSNCWLHPAVTLKSFLPSGEALGRDPDSDLTEWLGKRTGLPQLESRVGIPTPTCSAIPAAEFRGTEELCRAGVFGPALLRPAVQRD